MQKWYSKLFHLSPYLHLSLPACSVSAAACRTPPVDFVRRRWTSSTARPRPNGPGKSPSATWPALGTSSRAHASQAAPRAATTPPALRRAAAAPLARRRAPLTQIDRPQLLHPSPRSSLAYKDPQNSTVARLLLLLPPPVAPPWPPRSRSRGLANPALHCPLSTTAIASPPPS